MNIEVTNLKSEIAAAIMIKAISMDKIAETMNSGYTILMGYIAEQGKQIAGVPCRFYRD